MDDEERLAWQRIGTAKRRSMVNSFSPELLARHGAVSPPSLEGSSSDELSPQARRVRPVLQSSCSTKDGHMLELEQQKLEVKLLQARHLALKEIGGKPSPYCILRIEERGGDGEVRSQVHKRTMDPVFDETFKLDGVHRGDTLVVLMYDWQKNQPSEPLGSAHVVLDDTTSLMPEWFELRPLRPGQPGSGEVQLQLSGPMLHPTALPEFPQKPGLRSQVSGAGRRLANRSVSMPGEMGAPQTPSRYTAHWNDDDLHNLRLDDKSFMDKARSLCQQAGLVKHHNMPAPMPVDGIALNRVWDDSATELLREKLEAQCHELEEGQSGHADEAKQKMLRRSIYDTMAELQGNIRVMVRVRPLKRQTGQFETVRVELPCDVHFESSLKSGRTAQKSFEYDRVFGPTDSQVHRCLAPFNSGVRICATSCIERCHLPCTLQMSVYEELKDAVAHVLQGYNCVIAAYGHTGSGKTHSMFGPRKDRGVNYRALSDLITLAQEDTENEFEIKASHMEIYNEEL